MMPDANQGKLQRQSKRYLCGFFLSTAGSFMCPIALTFGLIHRGFGPAAISSILFATVAPAVFLSPVTGLVADRFGRRRVMICCDLVRGCAEFTLLVALWSGTQVSPLLFTLLAAVLGLGQACFLPASVGFVREIAGSEQLQTVLAWQSTMRAVARIGAPALAGLIVQAGSADRVLLLDALSFLCNAGLLLTVREVRSAAVGWHGGFRKMVHTLAATLRRSHWLAGVFAFESFFHMVVYAPYMTLGPVVASRFGNGSAAWGFITSLEGAGAVLASMAITRIKIGQPLRVAYGVAGLASMLPLALASGATLSLMLAAAAMAGAAIVSYDILKSTAVQSRVDGSMLSSIASFDVLTSSASLSLGYVMAPSLSHLAGIAPTLAASAVSCAAISLMLCRSRPLSWFEPAVVAQLNTQ
jgi:MFS family permease